MPNKKQSARPAESGWLLEAGVIGIDKTLKFIKLSKWTLVELEILVRAHERLENTDAPLREALPVAIASIKCTMARRAWDDARGADCIAAVRLLTKCEKEFDDAAAEPARGR